MRITSPAFEDGGMIPRKYTCQGEDACPPLEFVDPPEGVKSFAVIVRDPDAPGNPFVHWLIWNINPDTRRIEEATTPVGAMEGMTGFGRTGWGGPCPPSGTHRYEFHLYALDTILALDAGAGETELRAAMEGRILEEAVLTGLYGKSD